MAGVPENKSGTDLEGSRLDIDSCARSDHTAAAAARQSITMYLRRQCRFVVANRVAAAVGL